MATYFGSASNPADNGSLAGSTYPVVITPPANMLAGDLVVVMVQLRYNRTLSVSNDGGQAWTSQTQFDPTSTISGRIFWCRFDGNWDANPSFTYSGASVGTIPLSAVMHVFRPSSYQNTWALDVAETDSWISVTSSPYTATIAGFNTNTNGALALAIFCHASAVRTYGGVGLNWLNAGSNNYRNTSGSDQNSSYCYQILAAAGATGNAVQTMSGNTGTISTSILAFKEVVVSAIITESFNAAVGYDLPNWNETVGSNAGCLVDEDSTGISDSAGGATEILKLVKASGAGTYHARAYNNADILAEVPVSYTTIKVHVAAHGLGSEDQYVNIMEGRDVGYDSMWYIRLINYDGTHLAFMYQVYNDGAWSTYYSDLIATGQWYRVGCKYDHTNHVFEFICDTTSVVSDSLVGTHFSGLQRIHLGDADDAYTVTMYLDELHVESTGYYTAPGGVPKVMMVM